MAGAPRARHGARGWPWPGPQNLPPGLRGNRRLLGNLSPEPSQVGFAGQHSGDALQCRVDTTEAPSVRVGPSPRKGSRAQSVDVSHGRRGHREPFGRPGFAEQANEDTVLPVGETVGSLG